MTNGRAHKTLLLTGVPAVGKTTLTRALPSDLLQRVTFGSLMFEIGRDKTWIKTPSDLEYMPLQQRLALQALAVAEVRRRVATTNAVLVDGHAIVDTPCGFLPGLTHAHILELSPDALILLVADPGTILARRDPERHPHLINTEERVALHQQILLHACVQWATIQHAYFEVIANEAPVAEGARVLGGRIEQILK